MNHRRYAFTLVELLVVIAIIGILVALLLPAIQAAREAGRRTSCSNNLSQLIIAVQNYELANTTYPTGTLNPTGPIQNRGVGYHHNWITGVLPYIEQINTYNAIDFQVGVYSPANSAARSIHLPNFQCPSSSFPKLVNNIASITYAGIHNDVEAPIDEDNNGVFILNRRLRYEDVKDGSSQTLFIGEKLLNGDDLGWMSGTRSTLRNLGTAVNAGGISAALKTFYSASRAGTGLGNGSAESETITDPTLLAELLLVGGFGSSHPAGALFAMGDGAVRFHSQSANLTVLQQMAHRADGALLDQRH